MIKRGAILVLLGLASCTPEPGVSLLPVTGSTVSPSYRQGFDRRRVDGLQTIAVHSFVSKSEVRGAVCVFESSEFRFIVHPPQEVRLPRILHRPGVLWVKCELGATSRVLEFEPQLPSWGVKVSDDSGSPHVSQTIEKLVNDNIRKRIIEDDIWVYADPSDTQLWVDLK